MPSLVARGELPMLALALALALTIQPSTGAAGAARAAPWRVELPAVSGGYQVS